MNSVKTIFQQIWAFFIPPAIDDVELDTEINVVLARAQERILTALLRFAAVFALGALLVSYKIILGKGRWDIIIFYLITIAIIWLFGIKRSINLKLRSWLFITLVYFLGAVDVAIFGVAEDWRLYLFGFSILAAMLLGWRAGIFATLLSAATFVVIANQISSGKIVITASFMDSPIPDTADIVTFGVNFLMIVGVIVTAVGTLLREFSETSLRERRAAQLLQQERDLLELRVADRTRELKERNDELEHSRKLAEAANQAKTVFLANMSHELRTPLNGILGYAQILRHNDTLTAEQAHGLDIIYQSGNHLKTLINDILDLSRIEAGKIEHYPAEIHLPTFLESVVGIIRMRAELKKLTFIYQTSDNLPPSILADSKRLRQILLNLLGNAIRYTDQGRVTFSVKAEHHQQQNENPVTPKHPSPTVLLIFEVQDTGVGISEEDLDKIFLPFEQVGDVNRRSGGTGLGLAITRQLVELMDGTINVKSELNVGSMFWFQIELPVISSEITALPTQPQKFTGNWGHRRQILIVEDEANNRDVLKSFLISAGFQATEAETGRQAVEAAMAQRPDLILMDLVMPDMDGYETIATMRQSPDLCDIPVVAVSANTAEQDRERCRQAGFNGFLVKPLDEQELVHTLAHQLNLTIKEIWEQPMPESENEAALVMPPQSELQALYKLAMFGSMERIEERAAYLDALNSDYIPFTNQLRQYTQQFNDEKIIELIQSAME